MTTNTSNNLLTEVTNELKSLFVHNRNHIAKLELEVSDDAAAFKTSLMSVVNSYLTAKGLSSLSGSAESAANAAIAALDSAISAVNTEAGATIAAPAPAAS